MKLFVIRVTCVHLSKAKGGCHARSGAGSCQTMKLDQQANTVNRIEQGTCTPFLHLLEKLMLEATCSLFSVPLGADEKEVGEESEEERIWNLLKEEKQREEKRQSEQKALEKERRELEKLDQERVITRAQFSMIVSAWYTVSMSP